MANAITPLQEVTQNLTRMEDDFKSVLPPGIEPKKFMAVVITAIQTKPELLENDRTSLFNACRECASDGLLADGREAALVPYKGKVKYMPMMMGLVKKLSEAGVSVNAQIVYQNDKFNYWTDEAGQHLKHEPNVFAERGEVFGAYCIAKYGETTQIEVMSKAEIETTRKQSKNSDGLLWTTFWGEAAKKTVLRRIYKWLPKTPEIERFIKKEDDKNFDFTDAQVTSAAPETSSRLSETMKAKIEKVELSETTTMPNGQKAIYGDVVEGPITELKVSTDAKRFGCIINGVIYSTADAEIYKIMETAADAKQAVRIIYIKVPGKNNAVVYEAKNVLMIEAKENVKDG